MQVLTGSHHKVLKAARRSGFEELNVRTVDANSIRGGPLSKGVGDSDDLRAELVKNEQHVALTEYLAVNKASCIFNELESNPSLYPSQQLLLKCLVNGSIMHQTNNNDNPVQRDLGPLAVTQPGLLQCVPSGEGRKLTSLVVALLWVQGNMPVTLKWAQNTTWRVQRQGESCTPKVKTSDPKNLAELIYAVMFEGASSTTKEVQRVIECIRNDNQGVICYKTSDGETRTMSNSIFFGPHAQSGKRLLRELPDLVPLCDDDDQRKKALEAIRKLVRDKYGHRIDVKGNEKLFLFETMLRGAVVLQEKEDVRIYVLGMELYKRVFRRVGLFSTFSESMFNTILIGEKLYTPFSWLLSRTVRFLGDGLMLELWPPIGRRTETTVMAALQGWVL
ncbi:Hypothetical Protein FCC1311_022112 [Hondaea fermentalgiana]|uniref:Uncharacterized protein n=1 Tax=Hondaea fermentalgiana TaxID=2315210 RepID=A0A2R5GCU9_9STRA|nr:Hypothetical Protein FCC1311_022112 [Hondaea fermentalgiana]|eukprot:GBG25991.1 Hypothetical Protein FCC1311_022112 [Hondaea fermentalgiana]